MIVVDTDVLSILDAEYGRDFAQVRTHLNAAGNVPIVTTVVSVQEQFRGWLSYIASSRQPAREIVGYRELLRTLRCRCGQIILEFDAAAVTRFEELRRTKLRTGTMDLKIASIALSRDLPLATRNVRDFSSVPGLRLLDWSK